MLSYEWIILINIAFEGSSELVILLNINVINFRHSVFLCGQLLKYTRTHNYVTSYCKYGIMV